MHMAQDEYLVDHCWIATCDHHLDDRLSYTTSATTV